LLSKQNGCKQIIAEEIEEIKAHTIPLKAKEATTKAAFSLPKTIYLAF
jgi:hypothetical protein